MEESGNRRTVERLWAMFDAGDFNVGALLGDDFICEWPQSGERIRGRDNFIAVNANYPRRVRIHLQRLVDAGDTIVTEILGVDADDQADIDRAVSFFELRDGVITRLREFWPDAFAAAEWRTPWVEPMVGAEERS